MALILSFSSRNNGNCQKIGEMIHAVVPNSSMFSFSDFSITPCGACGYECLQGGAACPHTEDMECRILDAIIRSDLVYFILPNYCDYPCANFFIFNERSNCFFQGKPKLLDQYLAISKRLFVVSNTPSEHFREVFTQQYGKRSAAGDLLDAEGARRELLAFLVGCK